MPLTSACGSRVHVLKANSSRLPFDETKHPRNPGGTSTGGRFRSMGGSTATGSSATVGDAEKFKTLKSKWARVNNELLPLVKHPESPEFQSKVTEMKNIVKEMYRLNVDTGGEEGIGLPGGPRDVVIVGAGPGGLQSAIVAGTDGLDTLLIDAQSTVGGQAKASSRVENVGGFVGGVTGEDLTQSMFQQAQRVGADHQLGVSVTGIKYDPETELKTLTLSDGSTVVTRSVILAGGIATRVMTFPGSQSSSVIYGDSKTVTEKGEGQTVVIIGGSNGAAQAALAAAAKAKHVILLARSPIVKSMSDYQVNQIRQMETTSREGTTRGGHPTFTVVEGDEISGLQLDATGRATAMTTKSGQRFDANIVGMFVGGAPNTKWLPPEIVVAHDSKDEANRGRVITDPESFETSMPGVFAVGDLRKKKFDIPRISTAIGEGTIAVYGTHQYFARKTKAA